MNWGPLHPDLESLSISRLNLIASDFTAYEILGPDMQIIAPWSETEARGVFAQPLTLVSDGEPVLGDEDGHVNFFVRRKRE